MDQKKRIKIYDFRRPDKFSRDQIRTVEIMHESFSRLAAADLSMRLAAVVSLHVASVDQLTYEEFIRSIPNPTSIGVIYMDPLRGSAVLEIDPVVANTCIDRLCGTRPDQLSVRQAREHTELEAGIMGWLYDRLMGHLRSAWTPILDLKPSLLDIVNVPAFAQVAPPNEMVILVTFETVIDGFEGMINLMLPYLTIEPILNRLSPAWGYSIVNLKDGQPATRPDGPAFRGQDARLDMELVADARPLSLAALASLKPGDLIPVDGLDQDQIWLQSADPAAPRPAKLLGLPLTPSRPARRHLALSAAGPARQRLQAWKVRPSGAPDPAASRILAPRHLADLPGADQATGQAVEQLGQRLEAVLRDLGQRLGEVQSRQDALADQLLYGSTGQAGNPDQAAAEDLLEAAPAGRPAISRVPGTPNPAASRPGSLATQAFTWVQPANAPALGLILQAQRTAIQALILSRLPETVAAAVLDGLPDPAKPPVIQTLVGIGPAQPDILALLDRSLASRLLASDTSQLEAPADSLKKAVSILNLVSRRTEKIVVEALEQAAPAVSEDIKRLMFVFEDICLLDPKSLRAVLAEVSLDDLALALKAARPETVSLVWNHLAPERTRQTKAILDNLGKVRLSDVEQAEQRVVECIRVLESQGRIQVLHPDEPVV